MGPYSISGLAFSKIFDTSWPDVKLKAWIRRIQIFCLTCNISWGLTWHLKFLGFHILRTSSPNLWTRRKARQKHSYVWQKICYQLMLYTVNCSNLKLSSSYLMETWYRLEVVLYSCNCRRLRRSYELEERKPLPRKRIYWKLCVT